MHYPPAQSKLQDNSASSTGINSNHTSITGLQTLNSSLKRIRLNEEESLSRSDSVDREWGAIDLTELDEADLVTESEPPSSKRPRKGLNEDGIKDEDVDDMDDFDISSGASTTTATATTTADERRILTGKPFAEGNTLSLSSTSSLHSTKTAKFHTSKPPKAHKPARSHNGMEDVFSHDQVQGWSEVRIKTWEHRRTNVEGFYYRFVDPTEGQQNGPWSSKSIREFMERLEEWKARGIRVGTSWGVFSMGVSNKAGYQCSSYYRKLLESKKLTDPAYAWEGGKLVMVNKSSGGEMAVSGLSERWDTEEVKEIEANVNRWIKEYHSYAGSRSAGKTKKPDSSTSTPKSSASTSSSSRPAVSLFKSTMEAPRVKATTAPATPRTISLRPSRQQLANECDSIPVVDISDKLAEYSSFMKKSTSVSNEPGRIRQTISLTVAGTITSIRSPLARAIVPIEPRKAPLAKTIVKGQAGLSMFWKNIPVRAECPDISKYIIPKDVEVRPTWAHRIQTSRELGSALVEGSFCREVPKMAEFDWASLSDGFDTPVSDFQGVLADPPWNFIVKDGRNDGACQLTTQEFGQIMEKALELMPNGIVSVWTHKAILPEVVNTMQGLGCRYVENLVWYKMALNNTNLDRASPYFRTSKEILLLFKKGDGFDIRHQRTADVIIDFEKPTSSWIDEDYTEPKPDGVFEMMEIMLPDARYTPEAGRGRLLELWAKKSQERRPGWFSIHELKHTSTTSAAPSSTLTATASTAQTAPLTLTASPVPNDSRIPVSPESASGDGGDTDSIDDVALLEIANDMDLDFNE